MRRIFLMPLVVVMIASIGCATATRLHTTPEGATVYVNGKLTGATPVVYDNDPGLPRRYHVQVAKPGYEPLDFYLDTRLSWLWGYLGFVAVVPYLWAWSLERDYVFVMSKASTDEGAAAPTRTDTGDALGPNPADQQAQPEPPASAETYLRP